VISGKEQTRRANQHDIDNYLL